MKNIVKNFRLTSQDIKEFMTNREHAVCVEHSHPDKFENYEDYLNKAQQVDVKKDIDKHFDGILAAFEKKYSSIDSLFNAHQDIYDLIYIDKEIGVVTGVRLAIIIDIAEEIAANTIEHELRNEPQPESTLVSVGFKID